MSRKKIERPRIDLTKIQIPEDLSHVLKQNGNCLLISSRATYRELEACGFWVNWPQKVCNNGDCYTAYKTYMKLSQGEPFGESKPCVDFPELRETDWCFTNYAFVGAFPNCNCTQGSQHKTTFQQMMVGSATRRWMLDQEKNIEESDKSTKGNIADAVDLAQRDITIQTPEDPEDIPF